jgi:hypothetical protein
MKRPIAAVWALLAWMTLSACRTSRPGVMQDPNSTPACSTVLDEQQVVDIAKRAIERMAAAERMVEAGNWSELTIDIRKSGCDYDVFVWLKDRLVAVEPTFMRIDERGRVVSFPMCCFVGDLGYCPEFCSSR